MGPFQQRFPDIHVRLIIPATNVFGTENYHSETVEELHKHSPTKLPEIIAIPHATSPIRTIIYRMQKTSGGVGSPLLYAFLYRRWLKSVQTYLQSVMQPDDVVHYVNHVAASLLPNWRKALGGKHIFGPVSGTEALPIQMSNLREVARNIAVGLTRIRLIRVLRKNDIIFCISNQDYAFFKRRVSTVIRLSEQNVDRAEMSNPSLNARTQKTDQPNHAGPLKILWVGELVRRKRVDVLKKIVEDTAHWPVELTIIGHGPLRRMLADVEVLPNIKVMSRVTRNEVLQLMRGHDVLLHTSYREATATVITEAVNSGCRVLCHNVGGHSLIVTDPRDLIPIAPVSESALMFMERIAQLIDGHTALGAQRGPYPNAATWSDFQETLFDVYNRIFNETPKGEANGV